MFGGDELLVMAYGSMVLLAVACGYASKDSTPAAICASGLAASWLIYILSWSPYSPALLLSAYVVDTNSIDVWSFCNMLNGLLVLYIARDKDWGKALVALLLCALANDVLYWSRGVSWASFRDMATLIFLTENALFLAIGGPSLWQTIRASDFFSLPLFRRRLRGVGLEHGRASQPVKGR